jgi:cytochrome c
MLLAAVLAALVLAPAPSAAEALTEDEKSLIKNKCTICHTEERILNSDPAVLRSTLETMKQKNPAFFADVDDEALDAALRKMLNDPAVAARRKAWSNLLADGRALFGDASLGTVGKSCASCHDEKSLRGVAGDYPKFDEKLGRHVSLLDKINWMISSNMKGKILPLGDPKSVALEAYLKSLR